MTNEQRVQLTPDALDACRNELAEMRDDTNEYGEGDELFEAEFARRSRRERAAIDLAVLACAELADRLRKDRSIATELHLMAQEEFTE